MLIPVEIDEAQRDRLASTISGEIVREDLVEIRLNGQPSLVVCRSEHRISPFCSHAAQRLAYAWRRDPQVSAVYFTMIEEFAATFVNEPGRWQWSGMPLGVLS